jgi:hypothetical protein
MFQKCPICKGKGTFKKSSCPTCLGERIINNDSGLPPSKIFIPTVYPIYPYYQDGTIYFKNGTVITPDPTTITTKTYPSTLTN